MSMQFDMIQGGILITEAVPTERLSGGICEARADVCDVGQVPCPWWKARLERRILPELQIRLNNTKAGIVEKL